MYHGRQTVYLPSFTRIGTGVQTTEMASGGIIYVPSFITIGPGIQKFRWGHTYRQTNTHILYSGSPSLVQRVVTIEVYKV
jgi:hypothetical protein